MSAAASWSYTATATLWPRKGRDEWSGAASFGPPEPVACDYGAESKTMRDARGAEFVVRHEIFTERADIKAGDMIMIGASTAADPLAAGAEEVRSVTRHADTFDRKADDWVVAT